MVCKNYDLCSKCEAQKMHCHHPSIQIKEPGQYPVNLSVTFDGKARKYFSKQEKRLRQERKEAEKLKKKEEKGEVVDPSTLKQTKVESKNFLSSLGWL